MIQVALEPCYVLHARSYRESSLLLETFSRDHGRVGLVARGARGSRSRWRNLLQPFRPLLLSWNMRGELGTLTGAEQVASPPAAQGEALFCGLYVNELLLRSLHRSDPHPDLFESYRSLLTDLATVPQLQPVLRVFEMELLESLGLGLQLQTEHGTGAPISPEARYRYVPESGPVRIESAAAHHHNDRTLEVSGEALLALRDHQIDERHLRELKRLMRSVLQFHLGDKPLKTLSLFH